MNASDDANPQAPASRLRLLIVDDHAIVREGLRRILDATGEPWGVAEASTGLQALELMRQRPVDVAIVDLSMPGMSGLELTRRIKVQHPRTGVLMLSMHAEEQYAMRAFKNGANGYLTKDSVSGELVAAVRKIVAGGIYVTPGQAERAVLQLNPHAAPALHAELTDRELDVLRRLVAGERPKEIADALCLSIKTISTHKARIQEKLGLPTTAALIRYGIEQGLASERVAEPRPEP